MRRLFTNSSAKATWSADNGFFTCLVSMAECCICKEADGQVACPKSCRQAGLMHLTCILNYIATTAVPKCPACRCQLPAWVVGSWKEMAANRCIGGNSGQQANSRALTLKLKPPETKAPTPQPQKKKKKAKLTSTSQLGKKKAKTEKKEDSVPCWRCPTPGVRKECKTYYDKSNFNRHMRAWHAEDSAAPPPLEYKFSVPPEEQRGCLLCARGFLTSQALSRHRSSPACGPPIAVEPEGAELTSVKLKLQGITTGDRYTATGVVEADDIYLHSAYGFTFLRDASGFLETPPTPVHAHDPMVACSSVCYVEREDMFDILE